MLIYISIYKMLFLSGCSCCVFLFFLFHSLKNPEKSITVYTNNIKQHNWYVEYKL